MNVYPIVSLNNRKISILFKMLSSQDLISKKFQMMLVFHIHVFLRSEFKYDDIAATPKPLFFSYTF